MADMRDIIAGIDDFDLSTVLDGLEKISVTSSEEIENEEIEEMKNEETEVDDDVEKPSPKELYLMCASIYKLYYSNVWICHKSKKPMSPKAANRMIDPTDTSKCVTFFEAEAAAKKFGYDGISLMLTEENSVCCIDIDHCVDENGNVNELVAEVIKFIDSYAEISTSGTGVHIFYFGKVHPEWRKKLSNAFGEGVDLELYQCKRHIVFTGNYLNENMLEIIDAEKQVTELYEKFAPKPQEKQYTYQPVNPADVPRLTDEEVLNLMFSSKNGNTFKSMYYQREIATYANDDSRADAALLYKMAYYTKDPEQLDRLYRQSKLMRDKWDSARGDSTYGRKLIYQAIANVKGQYIPQNKKRNTNAQQNKFELLDFGFDTVLKWELNQIATSKFFAKCIEKFALYIPEQKVWYVYNGKIWQSDIDGSLIGKLAKQFVERINKIIPKEQEINIEQLSPDKIAKIEQVNQKIKDLRRYYSYYLDFGHRLKLCKDTALELRRHYDIFDKNPYLFNVQNGTFNLKTIELQAHRAEDYLTRIANVTYDTKATCPRFEQFFEEIMMGDWEKGYHLQKVLDYSLFGTATEECLFYALGTTTRNGKGTLFSTLLTIFGSYGAEIDFGTIARTGAKDSRSPSPDLARLAGVRLVICSEPDKGTFFNEALVKEVTGNDRIACRGLYSNIIEFVPVFKLIITANSLPPLTDFSMLDSDRLKIIEFNRHFSEEERDTNLKTKFAEETAKSAIFNWLIEGYRKFVQYGLKDTEQMKKALATYREECDSVGQFINERLTPTATATSCFATPLIKIKKEYIRWCRENAVQALSFQEFKAELERHKINVFKSKKQYMVGATLSSGYDEDEERPLTWKQTNKY